MEQRFVADGPERLAADGRFQACCRELRAVVYAKYAEEMAAAGFFRRFLIRYKRYRDCSRALAEITPSPESLWVTNSAFLQGTKGDPTSSSLS